MVLVRNGIVDLVVVVRVHMEEVEVEVEVEVGVHMEVAVEVVVPAALTRYLTSNLMTTVCTQIPDYFDVVQHDGLKFPNKRL
jgi:hypothetical protein